MKKRTLAVSLLGCLLFLLTSCGSNDGAFTKDSIVATTDELKKWMERDAFVLIDARPAELYEAGHISGAINVEWPALSKMEGEIGDKDWGTLQDADSLSQSLGQLGINEDSKVIVYSNRDGFGEEGRLLWSLKRAGIEARMLQGGIDLWTSQGEELSTEVPSVTALDAKIDHLDDNLTISTEELKEKYQDLVLIDAREEAEYHGEVIYGEPRGGHIPGAINVHYKKLYNEDGTLKSPEDILSMMNEVGVNKDDPIITYCSGGVRSAQMAMGLLYAGFTNVRSYDSSMYEWSADESNPLE